MDDLVEEINKKKLIIKVADIGVKIVKTCEVCFLQFPLTEFYAHKKIHPERFIKGNDLVATTSKHVCTICGEEFQKEALLRIHQVQKHSLSLVARLTESPLIKKACRRLSWGCEESERKSNSATSKRFKCRHCEKRFVLSSQCKSHENAHVVNEVPVVLENLTSTTESKTSTETAARNTAQENLVLPSEDSDEPRYGWISIPGGLGDSVLPEVKQEITVVDKTGKEMQESVSSSHKRSNQSTNCEGSASILQKIEMPKLIAPMKLESIEFSGLSDLGLANFQGAHENAQFPCYISNLSTFSSPVKKEPEPCPSIEKSEVKHELATVIEQSGIALKNGDGDTLVKEREEKTHKCLTCGMVFPESQIFPHIKTHLVKGQKECSLCSYKAIASGDLRDHMNKHYSIKPYKCPVCPNVYSWQSGWKKHVATHDKGQKVFRCAHCSSRFETQRERRRHELIHKNISGPSPPRKKPKKRDIKMEDPIPSYEVACESAQGETYCHTQSGYQYTPQQLHHDYSAPYHSNDFQNQTEFYDGNATYNSSSYTQQSYPLENNSWHTPTQIQPNYGSYANPNAQIHDWNEHINGNQSDSSGCTTITNPNESLKQTDQASLGFRGPDDLRENEMCKTCGEVVRMNDLPNHIQTHILPGQKSCTICKYKCSTKRNLGEHYNIHYGLKPFACEICKRRFAMQSYLRSHIQQVHENESTRRFQCRYCNKRFVRPCHLRTHEKIHENQGEVFPPNESSIVDPIMDSDSSSNSNTSFRPIMSTPERNSSNSNPSIYSHSNTNSPHAPPLIPYPSTPKREPPWSGVPPTGTQTVNSQGQSQPWPYWEQSYSPGDLPVPAGSYDNNGWSQNGVSTYYYSPLVKSDVNWTEPLVDSSPWQHNQCQSTQSLNYSPQVKFEPAWSESSNGFRSSSNTPCPSVPPSASVHDLWAELHLEEMNWFPETTTAFTADGIPMITELAPFDGFSYTEMLHNATADLPLFNNIPPNESDSSRPCEDSHSSESRPKKTKKKVAHGGWEEPDSGPRPGRNYKGRGKGKLTAEAKHKIKMNFVKEAPTPTSDTDFTAESSLSPIALPGVDIENDADALVSCQSCPAKVAGTDLLFHIRSHLLPGQRTCELCQRTYCNPLTLREHIHVHYGLRPYKCSSCEEKFSSKYSLKTHETLEHEEGKVPILKCPFPGCGKLFTMKCEFHEHVKTHTNKNGTSQHPQSKDVNVRNLMPSIEAEAYAKLNEERIKDVKSKTWEVRLEDIGRKMRKKCPLCGVEILLADFFDHKYSHREPCHICQKPVLCTEIVAHGPTHVGSDVQCEICGWKAQQRSQLWEHMNGHLKVKPIRCLYCGNGFASRNSLRSHYLALHTNFRPHSCRFCNKTFVQGNTVKQHELTHFRTKLGQHLCPACPEYFAQRKDLQRHLREIHKFDY